jgi:two-component system alkaline phosphatase synthesis response regulator PhoP
MAGKILIADDEPHLLKIVADRLKANNFEIVTAEDGGEALKKAAEKPDVILLDIMMPVFDGYETLKRLRTEEATKNIPVIMLTARGDPAAVEKCQELGAADYVVKPINPAVLIEKIRGVLK